MGYLATAVPLRLASAGIGVAIPILAVQRLDDVALGGALVAASLGPSIIAAPLVGVALDRTARPRLLLLASAVVTALGFALAAFLGDVPTPLVAIGLVLTGFATPFFMGGLSSFVTDAVADERKAYAYDALAYNVGAVAGPAVVALAVALESGRSGVLAMAAFAALGLLGTAATRLAPRGVRDGSVLQTIAAGTRHLTRHRPLAVVTASGTLSQLGGGALPIAAVALAIERAGTPDEGAVIVTAFAIGGLLGAVVTTAWPIRWAPEWTMGLGFVATGLLTVAAVADLGLAWTIVVIGLSGLFTSPSAAAMLLIRKLQSPLRVRSQVFTVGSGLRAAAAAAGAALAGVFAGVPAGWLIGAVGVVWIASALLLLAYPRGAEPVDD